MHYTIEGELTKTEYYKFYFSDKKFGYFLILLLSFIIGNMQIGFKTLFTVSFLMEYGYIVLKNWLIVILMMGTLIFIPLIIIAFINKRKYLGHRIYTFSEDGMTLQTEVETVKVPWESLIFVKEKRTYHLLVSNKADSVYLMNRFFDSEQQKNDVLAYINKKKGGGK